MTAKKTVTREEWLNKLVHKLRPRYGVELPESVHVSVGFPSSGIRSKVIGECWNKKCSADEAPQVFIHPKLSDAVEVAAVVVHELIHACRPDAKHGPEFKSLALQLGLAGKMRATVAGDELKADLAALVEKIGPYPHPALTGRSSSAPKKQTTRMIKVGCPDCGYSVRTTEKWLQVGMPQCPDGTPMWREL